MIALKSLMNSASYPTKFLMKQYTAKNVASLKSKSLTTRCRSLLDVFLPFLSGTTDCFELSSDF